jgi:hypothetical protein
MEISNTADSKYGESIAIIDSNGNNKIIYVNEKNPIKEIKCEGGEHIQQIPNVSKERDVIYCSGMSGSGKSYYIKNYADKYKKLYPKRNILLFSGIDSDSGSLDKIKDLKRVKIYEDGFINEEFSVNDFEESLVIFDDLEMIRNKLLFSKVMKIQDDLLQGGRHSKTSVAVANHSGANGKSTKLILNEASSIVLYPNGIGKRVLTYILEQYMGLDKNQIKRIKKLRSRWITIVKTYPLILLYEKGAFVLNDYDED